jgi:hypothetical protein
MKYLNTYKEASLRSPKLFEHNSFESVENIPAMFNLITDAKIVTIPYLWKKNLYRTDTGFNIHVLYGDRMIKGSIDKKERPHLPYAGPETDYKTLQEIYQNVDILKKIYNVAIYAIFLTETKVVVIFKDYFSKFDMVNYIYKIPYSNFQTLPIEIKDIINPSKKSDWETYSGGIEYTDGSSSNLSLFDWLYDK